MLNSKEQTSTTGKWIGERMIRVLVQLIVAHVVTRQVLTLVYGPMKGLKHGVAGLTIVG